MSEKISVKLRWFTGAPECPCHEAADALDAKDAEIERLKLELAAWPDAMTEKG